MDSWDRGNRCFWKLIAIPCAPFGAQHGSLGTPAGDELRIWRGHGSEAPHSAHPWLCSKRREGRDRGTEEQLRSPISHFANCTLGTGEEMKEVFAGVAGEGR